MDLCERLSFIFGTEENVRTRRQFVLLREKFTNLPRGDKMMFQICSGSLGEGVVYPSSDDDLMIYDTRHHVVKTYREASRDGDLHVLMVPSVFSPGYCLLLDIYQQYPNMLLHNIGGRTFLSSSLWKQIFLHDGEFLHGPCQSQKMGDYEYDFAHCIKCDFWPDAASNWISRNRSRSWPSHDTIQNILMNGCHVVPIGDQSSLFHKHEWRISFSVAERTLMHSFNHVQFLTYNLLRLCLKEVISERSPGVLCSYFLKTTVFYTSENTPQYFWEESNIETCFKSCLSVLYDYFVHGNFPNYFIPEYNMIQHKMNYTNRYVLLDTIQYIRSLGIVGTIHLCGESFSLTGYFSTSLSEMRQDILFQRSYYALTFEAIFEAVSGSSNDNIESYEILFHQIFRLIKNISSRQLSNIIFQMGNIFCCQKLMSRLWRPFEMNKKNYRLHRIIESLLRIGYNADLTTGKLTAASYMYLIGKTQSALSHVRRLLSEYTPYTIDIALRGFNEIQFTSYMDVMCSRGYTIYYKMQHAHLQQYLLDKDIWNSFPVPLRIWLFPLSEYNLYCLDPLTYAYFLESICYIRMKNETSLIKATRCLLHRSYDLKNAIRIIDSRMCVGIIKYVQGDSQSACRWLGSAYILKDRLPPSFIKKFSWSVMTYVACLLNRRFFNDESTVQNAKVHCHP